MGGGKIVFVGNHYESLPGGEERLEMIDFMKKHVEEFEVFGSISGATAEVKAKDVPDIYNNSFAVICENNMNDIDGYFTPRNIGAMAAGSCSLNRAFPGIGDLFMNYRNGINYRHKYELLDAITFLKKNPAVRYRIAKSGHLLAKIRYTNDSWVQTYLKILKY